MCSSATHLLQLQCQLFSPALWLTGNQFLFLLTPPLQRLHPVSFLLQTLSLLELQTRQGVKQEHSYLPTFKSKTNFKRWKHNTITSRFRNHIYRVRSLMNMETDLSLTWSCADVSETLPNPHIYTCEIHQAYFFCCGCEVKLFKR